MPFMQWQITGCLKWWEADTPYGIDYYPADDFTQEEIARMHDIPLDQVTAITGYGARLSAPGYLDCTDWSVFDTPEAALALLG